jgi:hypothetical protein
MATKATDKSGKKSAGMDWGSRSYNSMGNNANGADSKKRDDENIPWTLLITVMAVLLTFFIVMPILAFMYYDMYYAHQAAIIEIRKMKELRREILIERMYRD